MVHKSVSKTPLFSRILCTKVNSLCHAIVLGLPLQNNSDPIKEMSFGEREHESLVAHSARIHVLLCKGVLSAENLLIN